jgi:MarR family transcriptional regulator for hemolysin
MGRRIEAYHEDPAVQTFMLFIQAAREVTRFADSRLFRSFHLSSVKYIALKALAHSGGTLTKSDLAIWTDTKRHNITTLVKRMEAEGLVTTESRQDDKRFKQVTLTDRGRDLFVKATAVAYDLINGVMSGIGKRQVAQLDRILRVLKNNTQTTSGK